tara:strand:- start:7748 stop:9916 length:2169 start_codon:yes stop_codon:yes gene_type:complete
MNIRYNFKNVSQQINKEGLDLLVVSYGGSSSNTLVNTLEREGYTCSSPLWRDVLCHCPKYIDCDIPIIYIYNNPIKSFLSMKRRGKGFYDINQKKLSNCDNVNISDETLLKLMIHQFQEWTDIKRDNVLIIHTAELFKDSINDKLNTFLKTTVRHFPIEYRNPKTNTNNINAKLTKLFDKYKNEIDEIINFKKRLELNIIDNENITQKIINDIPLHVIQTYKNIIPHTIQDGMELLRKQNPEFKFYFYNDDDILDFIKNNYDKDVLDSFNKLIPGAYKADLFRYCILYKYGGVYMDIKLVMSSDYKLINLIKYSDELHVLDDTTYTRNKKSHGKFIYQGMMITKSNNIFIKDLIDTIVKKCKYYELGKNPLDITGPNMYWHQLKKYINKKNIDYKSLVHRGSSKIYLKSKLIIEGYKLDNYNKLYGKNRYYLNYPNNVYNYSIIDYNIACCLCVRNCEKHLNKIFENLKQLIKLFKKCYFIFVYDNCSDNTEKILLDFKNNNDNVIIRNIENTSKCRTTRIAKARNECIEIIYNDLENIDYHIMIDADNVNTKKWNVNILPKYFCRDDWDCLTFNREGYYDIWALLYNHIQHHCWGYNDLDCCWKIVSFMRNDITKKLKDLDEGELFTCYSAFNGFGIYRTNVFKDIHYEGIYKNFKQMIPNGKRKKTLKFFKKFTKNKKLEIVDGCVNPGFGTHCEHLYYHLSAIQQKDAKIRITKECLNY